MAQMLMTPYVILGVLCLHAGALAWVCGGLVTGWCVVGVVGVCTRGQRTGPLVSCMPEMGSSLTGGEVVTSLQELQRVGESYSRGGE